MNYLPEIPGIPEGLRAGRSPRDGYVRGWGLEFGGLAGHVRADPLYQEAVALITGRSFVSEERRMNLFLLLKFYLPKLASGHIIEFGAYKGGNAVFMAHVAAKTAARRAGIRARHLRRDAGHRQDRGRAQRRRLRRQQFRGREGLRREERD